MVLAANVLTLAIVMGTTCQNILILLTLQLTAQLSVVMASSETSKNAMTETKSMAMAARPLALLKRPGAALLIPLTLVAPFKPLTLLCKSKRS